MSKKKIAIYGIVLFSVLVANYAFAGGPTATASNKGASLAEGIIIKYKDQDIIQSALQFEAMSQEVESMLGDLSDQIGMALNHERVLASGAQLISTADDINDFEFLDDLADMIERDPRVIYAEPNGICFP